MCDPTGFRFELFRVLSSVDTDEHEALTQGVWRFMGDETKLTDGLRLRGRVSRPLAIFACSRRARSSPSRPETASSIDVAPSGVYRVEGWLECGGEERGWIYSNPIYIR